MLMIPLPFVIALFAIIFLLRELVVKESGRRNGWLVGFLCLFIFQEVLIGLRFGYSQNWLREIQPLSAAMLPPLAYLSFRRPFLSLPALVHLLPLLAVIVVLVIFYDLLDAVLAINNLVYAIALIRLGFQGSDALGWVEISRTQSVMLLLWLVSGILVISGMTDAAITYDFWRTNGTQTALIAGWASAFGIALTGIGFVAYRLSQRTDRLDSGRVSTQNAEVFDDLNVMMGHEKLYLDPDINLNRIARRMVLPARDVSRAVNASSGGNVSQYVNKLRIEEACRLLAETDMSVIQIAFASGFNTKSNFNREFARINSQSPSEWRESNHS